MFGFNTMRCLICVNKLSKKEKKYIKAAQVVNPKTMEVCTTCVLGRNKVLAKMKKVQHA